MWQHELLAFRGRPAVGGGVDSGRWDDQHGRSRPDVPRLLRAQPDLGQHLDRRRQNVRPSPGGAREPGCDTGCDRRHPGRPGLYVLQHRAVRRAHRAAGLSARWTYLRGLDRGRPCAKRRRLQHHHAAVLPHALGVVLGRRRQHVDTTAGVRRGHRPRCVDALRELHNRRPGKPLFRLRRQSQLESRDVLSRIDGGDRTVGRFLRVRHVRRVVERWWLALGRRGWPDTGQRSQGIPGQFSQRDGHPLVPGNRGRGSRTGGRRVSAHNRNSSHGSVR